MSRSRGYCFTINNPTDDDCFDVLLLEEHKHFRYLVFGLEVGDEGTEHFQGYVLFREKVSFDVIKSMLSRAHIESQKGSDIDALLYTMKDNKYVEIGERPRQGKRSDLDVIKKDLDNGVTLADISKRYFTQYLFHRRSFEAYIKEHNLMVFNPCQVFLYNPNKGCGMYRKIKMMYPNIVFVRSLYDQKFYSPYVCVLSDEARLYNVCEIVFNNDLKVLICPFNAWSVEYESDLGKPLEINFSDI